MDHVSLKDRVLDDVKFFMYHNKISQRELSNRMNVSHQYVSQIFKGEINISLGTLEKILSAANAEITMFLTYKEH